jgi:6-phosphogluconolactonase
MLQGVGDDGHTASLFPGTSALHEQHKKVTAVYVEKFDSWRISVTFPVIDRARHVFVLAAGEGKKAILHEIFMKPAGQLPYPIQMLKPQGEYVWYVDEDAAANISGDFIIRPGV